MLISYPYKFIFIKTCKTASTSVEAFFEKFCCPPGHVVQHWTDEILSDYGIVGYRGPQKNNHKFKYANHMSCEQISNIFSNFNEYIKITTVRDPYDRAISEFHFTQHGSHKIPLDNAIFLHNSGQIDRLRRLFESYVLSTPYVQEDLICINGELAVDRWIKYENLINDIQQVVDDLNLPLDGSVSDNLPFFKKIRFGRSDLPPMESYLTKKSVKFINEQSKLNFKHFGYIQRDPNDYS
jgi:hypothetical protein